MQCTPYISRTGWQPIGKRGSSGDWSEAMLAARAVEYITYIVYECVWAAPTHMDVHGDAWSQRGGS